MSVFTDSDLEVKVLDGDNYELLSSLVWYLEHEKVLGPRCVIHPGFVTDFDSTPDTIKWMPVVRKIIRSRLKAKKAFVMHDFGHKCGYIYILDRKGTWEPHRVEDLKFWNDKMEEAMIAEGSRKFTSWIFNIATSSFIGRKAWNRNRPKRVASFKEAREKYERIKNIS